MNEKLKRHIMVIKRDLLFADKHFEGFLPQHEYDFENLILENHEYIQRGKAEEDPRYRQAIPYALICNEHNEIFAFQRSAGQIAGNEKRLHGKWSWGVGGHVDHKTNAGANPIYETLTREIEEEIGLNSFLTINTLGYLNDESDSLGLVHFGILYLVKVNSPNITIDGREIAQGEFKSIQELEALCNDENCTVEEWSEYALEALKNNL